MCSLLNKMLTDIYRILCEQSESDLNENQNKINPKIKKNKYQLLRITTHLHKNVEVIDIYEQSKNNEEILNALNDLLLKKENDHELQVNIGTFIREIENYLKSEKKDMEYEKYIEKQKEELFLTQKQINIYRDEFNQKFDNMEKKYDNLNIKYNNLSQENNALKAKCNNLDTQVAQLKEKVEFMEPIVLSLICRKVLNYSIIKILEKYKRNIKVTVKINTIGEINYDIRFCSPVNNIDIVTLNIWLNNLFFRKDGFNSNSHLVNKDLPSFIPNIWEKVKESLNLDLGGAAIFDSLITEDIKSGFNFRADDVSINSYLKSVNINEFGN
jgi:chromosome segregation ATPase